MDCTYFLHHLICATHMDASNATRRKHLSHALKEAATVPGLTEQLEAIGTLCSVAQTVHHLIATQPKEQ